MYRFLAALKTTFWKNQWLSWKFFLFLSVLFWLIARYTQLSEQDIFSLLGLISAIICLLLFIQENIFHQKSPALSIPYTQYLNLWTFTFFVCMIIGVGFREKIPHWFWISIPLILGTLTILSSCLESGFKFRLPTPEVRHKLMIVALIHGLVSCWIQFYFIINYWVTNNPTLSQQDFSRSNFVINLNQ